MGFQTTAGSAQEINALCGIDEVLAPTGPKITSPSPEQFVRPNITLEGTCDGTTEVQISGGGLDAPVLTPCVGGKFKQELTLSTGDGMKPLQVTQNLIAGIAHRCVYVDTTPPRVLITTPTTPYNNQHNVSVFGECENGLDVQLREVGGRSITVACNGGKFQTRFETTSEDGTKNIVASQTDVIGNIGKDDQDYIVDTIPPAIKITSPSSGMFVKKDFTVIGLCETGLPVRLTGTATAQPVQTECVNGKFSQEIQVTSREAVLFIVAEQVDQAGNRGWDQRNVNRDTTPPTITITSPSAGTVGQTGLHLAGRCTEGIMVQLGGTGILSPLSVPCISGSWSASVPFSAGDGTKNIIASQTDAAGNVGSDARDFVRDNTPPPIKITAPDAGTVTSSAIALSGVCESGLRVELSGNIQALTVDCMSGRFAATVKLNSPDGAKTVTAAQTDAIGNRGTDTRSFELDTIPPAVTITSPPVGTVAQNGVTLMGTCTNGFPVQISGTGVNGPSTVNCISSQFSSAILFSPGDGTKNVVVSQTDAAGNTGSDNRNFVRDTVAPLVRITAPDADSSAQNGVTLTGTCETGVPVQIGGSGVAGTSTAACTNGQFSAPITFTNGDGPKTVDVSQTDAAGNTGRDTRNFIKDTTGPEIKITEPAAGTPTRAQIDLKGTCQTGLTVQISGDIVTQVSTDCTAGAFATKITLSSPDGTKSVTAMQTDSVGNVGRDSRDFLRTTAAPTIKITGPAIDSLTKGPLTVVGTCANGIAVDLAGDLEVAMSVTCNASTFVANVVLKGPDGRKTVTASQTDNLGNVGTDSRTFLLDTAAPLVKITAPPAGTEAQAGLTVLGTCETGLPVQISGAGVSGTQSVACTNAQFSAAVVFSNGDGTKNVIASQTDAAGNVGSDNRDFLKDTNGPDIKITAPPAGTESQTGVTLVGTCTTGLQVQISGAGVSAPSKTACNAGQFTSPITFSAGDGSKNVIASQTDAAGNTGSDNRNFVKDTTAPVIKITSPPAGTEAQTGVTLAGTCTTGLQVQISGAGVSAPSTTACNGGQFSSPITFSAGDGTKNVIASQTDAAGNTGSDNRNFVRDTSGPEIKITAPPAGTESQTGVTLVGTCTNGLPVQIGGTGASAPGTTTCNNGQFSTGVVFSSGDGVKNIVASQTDAAGNTGSDNRNFVRDTSGPEIKITAPPAGTESQTGVTLVGTCTNALPVEISGAGVNAPSTTTCLNGQFSTPILFSAGDGTKNVIASQTDAAGNTGSDNRNFVRDTSGPEIKITAPPAGTESQTGLTLVGTCTTGLQVQISGAGVTAPSTTACNGGQFSSPITFSAGDGTKNVIASQTDAAGNTGSDNRNFVRDTSGPEIKITAPPAGTESQAGVTLVGTCTTGLQVQISGTGVNAPSTTGCNAGQFTTPITFSAGDGTKNVIASQTDAAGNTGSDNRNFAKDTAGPEIKITSPPAGTESQTGVTLAGTCTTGLTVQISGAGVSAPSTTACNGGQFSSPITFSAGDGTKNVIASQTDAAGNVGSDNRNFVKDTTAPVIKITSPPAGTEAQTGVTLAGTCTTGLQVQISGAGVTAPSTTACNGGQFSSPITFSAGDGTKNVIVSQTDAAGNTGSDNRNFVRDTSGPEIKITAPPAGTESQTGVTLVGTCTTGLQVQISGTGVNAPSTTGCNAGQFSTPITFSAGDGTKNVIASQTDAAGNTGSDNRNFAKDTAGPEIKITSPPAGTEAQTGVTLAGTCTIGLQVQISGAGVSAPSTTACNGGQFSSPITFSSGDGTKNVIASQTDAAGNTGSDNRNFVKDTTAPVIKITSPPAGTEAQTGVTLAGTCTTGLQVQISGAGVTAPSTTACNGGQFSSPITFSAGDGTKNVIVSQTDAAGNTGSDNRNFVRDSSGPEIKITAPPAGTESQTGVTLVGTCTTGLQVQISGTGVSAPSTTGCNAGQFSTPITFSAGDGTKNVIASQTDAAGNTGSDNRNFVKDTTAPAIKITAPAAGTATRSTIALQGTCTNGLPIQITGGITASQTTSCSNGAFSATITLASPDGTKNVVVTQTDAVGNVGTDNRNFVLNTAVPRVTIAAPAAGTVTKSGLTISGTCVNGIPVQISGAVQTPGTAACNNSGYVADIVLSTGDGVKNVVVTQTDTLGNSGSDNRNFLLDTTAPLVKITGPAAGTIAQTGVTIVGTCETGLNVTLSGAGVAAVTSTACTNGQFSSPITFSAGDGNKNVVAAQTDLAGNTGSDNRSFVKDTTPPVITISTPAAGTSTTSTLAVGGNCTDGLAITLGGDISPSMAVCVGGLWNATITLLAPDGNKTLTASQTDAAGNTGSASRQFVLDTAPPAIKITAPAAGTVTRSSLTITGTCAAGFGVTLTGDIAASVQTACSSGTFTAQVTLKSPDGTKNVVASQTDGAGNNGSDSRNFVLDTTAPLVRILTPDANSLVGSSATITGSCEAGLSVQLSGSGIGAPGPVSCASGSFSANVTFSNGDGAKNIVASQTDAASNTGSDNRTFMKDTTAPVVKILTPPAGSITNSGLTLTGSCETGLAVTISGSGMSGTKSVTCASAQFTVAINLSSPDGTKNIVASQTDAAGNTGSDNRNFVLDTGAPLVTITSPANGAKLNGSFTLLGTCEAGLALNITGDIQQASTTTCPTGGNFSVALMVTAGNGSKKVTASQTDLAGNTGSDTKNYVVTPKPTATESFMADATEGTVDILFVDDNSVSMDPEQAALGQKFPSFVSELTGLDWQAGITTTDCSSGPFGICGSLLQMTGTSSYILDPNVPGYDQVFKNTIQRPETLNCQAPNCPSGLEEALKAAATSIDKRNTNNAGFFRQDAALAIVILTDEDEQSNAPPTATKPQAVIDKVRAAWGPDKKFKSYAITILSGDTQCLQMQKDQQSGIAFYGTQAIALANQTGGQAVSICAPDYSVTLRQIGQDLRKLTQAVQLSRTPVPTSVQVVFTPARNITWTVDGDTVLFNSPVPAGTKIDVTYEY